MCYTIIKDTDNIIYHRTLHISEFNETEFFCLKNDVEIDKLFYKAHRGWIFYEKPDNYTCHDLLLLFKECGYDLKYSYIFKNGLWYTLNPDTEFLERIV